MRSRILLCLNAAAHWCDAETDHVWYLFLLKHLNKPIPTYEMKQAALTNTDKIINKEVQQLRPDTHPQALLLYNQTTAILSKFFSIEPDPVSCQSIHTVTLRRTEITFFIDRRPDF